MSERFLSTTQRPWWLLLIPGLLVVSSSRRQAGPTLPDEVVATLYLRAGRLRLRRRKP